MNVLETERLLVRRLSTEDAEFILELLNEPSFLQNIGDRGVRNADDARSYILDGPVASYRRFGFGLFLVVLKESGESAGICGLLKRDHLDDVDVGFAFLPRFWSKGYALESASAVMAYARDAHGLKRVVAVTDPKNRSSIRLLGKLGFEFERLVRMSEDEPEIQLWTTSLDRS